MLNSTHVRKKVENARRLYVDLIRRHGRPIEAVNHLYLTVLSRYPTRQELMSVGAYYRDSGLDRRESTIDLVWAMINTKEFLYRH
jgi:hypothetical protein